MGCSSSLPTDGNASGEAGVLGRNDPLDANVLKVKLVLLGDSGVGKSCIVLRFVRGQFDPTSKVTIGASFLSQTISLQDSTTVKFEIWDTAGQERYAALAPLYYRGAAVAIIVYDITSTDSFHKAQYWVKELQKHGSTDIVLALVGNKADLEDKRAVTTEHGMDYAEKNGMFFIEASAKTADNINQLFEKAKDDSFMITLKDWSYQRLRFAVQSIQMPAIASQVANISLEDAIHRQLRNRTTFPLSVALEIAKRLPRPSSE